MTSSLEVWLAWVLCKAHTGRIQRVGHPELLAQDSAMCCAKHVATVQAPEQYAESSRRLQPIKDTHHLSVQPRLTTLLTAATRKRLLLYPTCRRWSVDAHPQQGLH